MEYFTLLTQVGAQKIAAATAANTTIALAEIALGDGNGTVPMPDASKTALVNEVYRAPLNDLRVDENNANWIVAEGYVPSDEGNFWVREVGIFDSDGDLIIIGNYSETFKPVTADGVAKDLYMKVITEVSSADAVTLLVDPSVVMASREYVLNMLSKIDFSSFLTLNDYSNIDEDSLNSIFPNRLELKWGTVMLDATTKVFNFPEAFLNQCFVVIPVDAGSGQIFDLRIDFFTNHSFTLSSNGVAQNVKYIAIGW